MLDEIGIASQNLKVSRKTAKYFSIVDFTTQILNYHAGYIHLFSPRQDTQGTYNGSFACTDNMLNTRTPMEDLFNVAVRGYDYKHPKKRLDNSWRNWYCSLNTFNSSRRLKSEVRAFGGFIVDCDCRSKQRDTVRTTKRAVWINRRVILITAGLPKPTAIIDSGHGYYFIWLFNHCVPNNCRYSRKKHTRKYTLVNLWLNEERKICRDFNNATDEIFGERLADPSAVDVAHVFRVPGSVNNKPGMKPVECTVKECSGITYSKRYWDKHYPYRRHHHKHYRKRSHRNHHKMQKHHNFHTLAYGIYEDLKTYASLKHYIINGCREFFLMYFCYWDLKYCGNVKGVIKDLHKMCKKLAKHRELPQSEEDHLANEVKTTHITTCKGNKGKYASHHNILAYRFHKRTMIDVLGITPAMQKHMSILKPSTKRQHRAEAKKRHAKRWKLRDDKVMALKNRGLSVRKIARKLKISRSTVGRIVKRTV